MKLQRLIPMIMGVLILLFGIYLVSTGGSVGGVYLPHLLGLPACNSNTNNSTGGFPSGGCGFSPIGLGVGTIVVIFGLGLLASSFRSAMASSSMGMGGAGTSSLPPEMAATLEMARSRMASMPMSMPTAIPPAGAPGIRPNTVYCSKCGQANLADARFCHQCGSPMPGNPAAAPSNPGP